jgi:hypothetical protein
MDLKEKEEENYIKKSFMNHYSTHLGDRIKM